MNRAELGEDSPDDDPWTPPRNWGLTGDYQVWEWFQVWKLSDYKQLPFDGGWVDQPRYVQRGFLYLLNLKGWHVQNSKRRAAPRQQGDGTFNDILR